MGRRSPSTSPSAKGYCPTEEGHGKQKLVRREVTQIVYEAGLQIKDKKASWRKSLKESQKREDELVQQTAELLDTTERAREEKTNLKTTSEEEVVFGRKKASPKKNSNNALKDPGHPGSLRRERQTFSQKRLGSCPRAGTRRVKTWNNTRKAL